MKIEYKEFHESDSEELEQMIMLLYKEDSEGYEMDKTKIEKTINEFFKNPSKIRIIMILCDDIVAGYSIIIPFWSNEYGGNILHIDELFIKQVYRNKGIGSNFIKNLAKMIDNAVALQLEVTPSNTRAMNYYKRMGFVKSKNSQLISKLYQ